MANKAISIWKIPSLSEDILENYKEKKQYTPTEWTIEDHPFLTNEYNRELFDALRKEIQGLDECVREEFLKKYVAYKAETNFIDVIPLTKKLRLILNMNFIEINDPRAFCRDITGLGCWGNGNVEVELDCIEDLPYIISLIRQSLEKQLSEDEIEE